MSKTNDTSKLGIDGVEAFTLNLGGATTFTVRELRDDELQKVSGGLKADSNEVAVEGFVSRFIEIGTTETLDMNMVGPSRRV